MTIATQSDERMPNLRTSGAVMWDEKGVRASYRRKRAILSITRLGVAIATLGLWELMSGALIDTFWISQPSEIGQVLFDWFVSSSYIYPHLGITMLEMVLGLVVGSVLGIATGFLLGLNRGLSDLVRPFITAFYSIPLIALAPLFILWLGIGVTSKVMLTSVIGFFLLFVNTHEGVRSVDRGLVDMVDIMGADRRQVLSKVVLPSAVPWILTGFRSAVPLSLAGAILAEYVASSMGLGWIIRDAAGIFRTDLVFSGLVVLMVLGYVISSAMDWMDSKLSRWRTATLG